MPVSKVNHNQKNEPKREFGKYIWNHKGYANNQSLNEKQFLITIC